MVKPLQDTAYSMCYIFTGEFRMSLQHRGACLHGWYRREVIIPLLCALPLWCRFMQCLRIFHDSQASAFRVSPLAPCTQ